MLAGNGFDEQHFQTVHDRRPLSTPQVDQPSPFAWRVRFRSEVIGRSIYDRLLRRFVGQFVDVSITNWGGSFFVVTGFFERAESYILIAPQPISAHQTRLDVIVFARRSQWAIIRRFVQPIGLAVRRRFTRGFVQDDVDRLGGICYSPQTLLPSDQKLIEFYDWLAGLAKQPPAGSLNDSTQSSDACRYA
jgi:hypothetical protein